MKQKTITLLTAIALAGAAVCTGFSTSLSSNASDNDADTIRIMAMGDSITHGYINGDNGYRKYFCYNMQQNGITNFDMVGPENSWSESATYDWNGTTITYDPQHAGYSGYAIQSTGGRTGITETIFDNTYTDWSTGSSGNMLEAYQPDLILLQIGTNDILDCQLDGVENRLEELVDKILPYVQGDDQMLFLASIPVIDVEVRSDWLTNYQWTLGIPPYSEDPAGYTQAVENAIDTYNQAVQALVEKKQAEGAHILFSDIHSVVDIKNGLADGVHPNEDGYACMGEYWASLVGAYLGQELPVTTSTRETTAPEETSTEADPDTTTETTLSEVTQSGLTTEETPDTTKSTDATETVTTEPVPLCRGDANQDGQVTLTDAVTLVRYLVRQQSLSQEAFLCCDINDDQRVNGLDMTLLRQLLLTSEVSAA